MSVQSGDGTPAFFAVVPPGENPVGYVKLAREMGNYPFYKLQVPGKVLDGRPYRASETQALAHEYVEAMRATQPKGPYYFGGMCDGAHIALRMAQILELQQEQVGMLAIFDTWVLENTQRPNLWRMHYYWQRLKRIIKLPVREQIKTVSTAARNLLHSLPKGDVSWQRAYWPGNDFIPPIFGGRITLFKRPRQPYYYVDDPTMGWGTRAGTIDIQVLSITHAEMLHDPHVRILAQSLSERLKYYCAEASAAQDSRGEDYITTVADRTEVG